MIKATIQNSPYCTEMTFPCTETELLINLGELGINKEHLAPTGTVIDIELALRRKSITAEQLRLLRKMLGTSTTKYCRLHKTFMNIAPFMKKQNR